MHKHKAQPARGTSAAAHAHAAPTQAQRTCAAGSLHAIERQLGANKEDGQADQGVQQAIPAATQSSSRVNAQQGSGTQVIWSVCLQLHGHRRSPLLILQDARPDAAAVSWRQPKLRAGAKGAAAGGWRGLAAAATAAARPPMALICALCDVPAAGAPQSPLAAARPAVAPRCQGPLSARLGAARVV